MESGKMKGTTYKRILPSGKVTWCYQVDAGHDETGKRIRIAKTGFKREQDADKELRQVLQERDAGELVKPDPRSFTAFMQEWFNEHAEQKVTPKTLERYKELAAYTYPHIGNVRLQDITTLMMQRVFNKVKESGGKNRKTKKCRPLAPKTVRHIGGLLHTAFQTAIVWGLIRSNPVIIKNLPKVEKKEARALDAAQLAWYTDAARAAGLYEFLIVAAGTGCRRGELLALTWDDVNLFARALSISKSLEQTRAGLRVKSTKTEKPRPVELAPSTVAILKEIRTAQENRRELYGADYRTDLNLVFCGPDGYYLKPDSVTAKACLIAKKAGLKDTSIHTLRHSHGSQLLSAGVPLPTVSKRLGHSDVHTTATIYAHALAKDERAAADAWETSVHEVIESDRKNAKIS
jgi:integrase